MKNNLLLYVVNAVLCVAVIVLFVLYATVKPDNRPYVNLPETGDSAFVFPVAYVNMDTLLINCDMYKRYSEELLKEEENSRLNINQKANALQAEMLDFQKKVENRIYATEERARSEQERLLKKQRELQELDARLAQELLAKRDEMNVKLKKSIDSVVAIYNADRGYDFIFCNSADDNILYGKSVYNITNEIVQMLNGK